VEAIRGAGNGGIKTEIRMGGDDDGKRQGEVMGVSGLRSISEGTTM
jgi:hypothetical protein